MKLRRNEHATGNVTLVARNTRRECLKRHAFSPMTAYSPTTVSQAGQRPANNATMRQRMPCTRPSIIDARRLAAAALGDDTPTDRRAATSSTLPPACCQHARFIIHFIAFLFYASRYIPHQYAIARTRTPATRADCRPSQRAAAGRSARHDAFRAMMSQRYLMKAPFRCQRPYAAEFRLQVEQYFVIYDEMLMFHGISILLLRHDKK